MHSQATRKTCSIEGCDAAASQRTWCRRHYSRWYRHGDPTALVKLRNGGALARFVQKTTFTGNCWEWTGSIDKGGYGAFRSDSGRTVLAHRWSYEFFAAPIPTGLTIDHLCKNRCCVNPDHMEPVPLAENTRRSNAISVQNAAKTVCRNGHPLEGENLWIENGKWRRCRQCKLEGARMRWAAKRDRVHD